MAQPTKPGNAERGWNDPPMFLYSPGDGGTRPPPTKRTALNKRVAFPGAACPVPSPGTGVKDIKHQTGTGVSSSPLTIPGNHGNQSPTVIPAVDSADGVHGNQIVLFPPASTTDLPRFPAPIIVPAMSPPDRDGFNITTNITTATNPVTNLQVTTQVADDQLVIPDFDDDQQLFNFVITRLQRVLKDCEAAVQPRVAMEIQKKLDILATMWESSQVSYQVKSIMARLATALHTRRCDQAHELHLGLMMDYVSEVGPWMVGIKRLIQEARSIQAPLSPTDSTVTESRLGLPLYVQGNSSDTPQIALIPPTATAVINPTATAEIPPTSAEEVPPMADTDNPGTTADTSVTNNNQPPGDKCGENMECDQTEPTETGAINNEGESVDVVSEPASGNDISAHTGQQNEQNTATDTMQ